MNEKELQYYETMRHRALVDLDAEERKAMTKDEIDTYVDEYIEAYERAQSGEDINDIIADIESRKEKRLLAPEVDNKVRFKDTHVVKNTKKVATNRIDEIKSSVIVDDGSIIVMLQNLFKRIFPK